MIENILLADQTDQPVSLYAVLLGMLMAFICGQALAWTYMFTHSGLSYSRTYVNALVVLPLLVAMVMMVLSNNLVTAFGLMALFAIVRFRNILRDTLDTCYLLSGITFGMASGTGRYATAVAGLIMVCMLLLYLSYTSFGSRHRYDMILNLQWKKPLNELARLTEQLQRHSRRIVCASQRTHPGQSGADLSYRILLRDPSRMHDLIAEVEALDGAAGVTGLTAQDESEL